MCGIALFISGIRIDSPYRQPHLTKFLETPSNQVDIDVEGIKAALRRRGPDSLGIKNVFLWLDDQRVVSESDELVKRGSGLGSCGKLEFIGATLQLRGSRPVSQPLVDSFGNVLVYNGEIFGGVQVSMDSNDAEVLMESLGKCCSCESHNHAKECSSSGEGLNSVPELLSEIKGPWALIYWQESSKTIWFGKDAFGRRSLLVHWPNSVDSRLLLSSVSSVSSICKSSDSNHSEITELSFWEELPCGVYSLSIQALDTDKHLVSQVRNHDWTTVMLQELIKWERSSVAPVTEQINFSALNIQSSQDMPSACLVNMPVEIGNMQALESSSSAVAVLDALRKSVMRRTVLNHICQAVPCDFEVKGNAPVAVLFSGGLDSMILAAILNECLDTKYEIDLLNVSFDGQSAPDRISSRDGLKELCKVAPLRRWKLVEIDAKLSSLTSEIKHVMSLIKPADTYMDLNIGIALWLAAGGNGRVDEFIGLDNDVVHHHVKYKSEARILLVGSGADEQCAGYGRHKTKYRLGSWPRLHEEMKLDMQRIWKRNLGRDDRCISDNGKEARFPFLDENVIRTLLDIPLWEIADLDQPSGVGDKRILREVAKLLGLYEAAVLPKRAIQFGSRIARESNRQNFGSNRAANQASAGSAVIIT
ncbi:uncharacterized protein LOC108199924 isoform X2 [Daucus carota subsp. sativus]|uniref:uncharacterized protein LOC108199924 isoform X2 n=1 Tax=Daucus carota subsp. sativus TaxID=79200 RepID=UPI0007F00E9B|nr:PREDICTED: asparagine synthetase domain-containing protein 1 [Daucus carota subsp. sativus]